MDTNTENLIENIIQSYARHDATIRLDAKNIVNKELLIEIIEKLRQVLFPGFFNKNRVRTDYLRYVLGDQIEFIQYNLKKQITKMLVSECECDCYETASRRADDITNKFLARIPYIREMLADDVDATYEGDPAAYSTDEIIFSYPGLFAITIYRIAHELVLLDVPMIPRIMTEYAHGLTGIDIHPNARIGRHFFIDHGTGIVIGSTTEIGDNVKIYQGVTLGALSTRSGQKLRGKKRHPTIGSNVTIYSNTSVLGGDTVIGDGATIGGNAFIVKSVPAGMRVSVRNLELEYSGVTSDFQQDGFWDWVI